MSVSMPHAPVVAYVTEEVRRQGHDVTALDGIERVAWMLRGWSYALASFPTQSTPKEHDARALGFMIEPNKNYDREYRHRDVRVGPRQCPEFELVPRLMRELWEILGVLAPLEFYRRFELIHPFVDGNGRAGKILLNWLSGTLLDPVFPPGGSVRRGD